MVLDRGTCHLYSSMQVQEGVIYIACSAEIQFGSSSMQVQEGVIYIVCSAEIQFGQLKPTGAMTDTQN